MEYLFGQMESIMKANSKQTNRTDTVFITTKMVMSMRAIL
jgi:hypothetical protein